MMRLLLGHLLLTGVRLSMSFITTATASANPMSLPLGLDRGGQSQKMQKLTNIVQSHVIVQVMPVKMADIKTLSGSQGGGR